MRKIIILAMLTLMICGIAGADEIDDIIPYIIQDAVSKAGAVGLMQITPIVLKEWNNERYYCNGCKCYCDFKAMETIPEYKYRNLYNPKINLEVGEWYLRRLKDHYLQDMRNQFTGFSPAGYHTGDWDNPAKSLDGWRKYTLHPDGVFDVKDLEMIMVLSAYNGGITRLKENNYDINKMPRETRNYVKRVMKLYKEEK